VPGPRTDSPTAGMPAAPGGYHHRPTIRVTSLYATPWRLPADHARLQPLVECLGFGRLGDFYHRAARQLPAVVATQPVDPAAVRGHRWTGDVRQGRLWLFATPSGQVVAALSLDVAGPFLGVIDLLEDSYYQQVTLAGGVLTAAAAALAREHDVLVTTEEFLPERHQLVFTRALDDEQPEDIVQRLVYRADLPLRAEFSAIAYPSELNRRPTSLAAVGPYVSVLCGQQDYIENAAFVSAAQAVASAARLREIRDRLYHDLLNLSREQTTNTRSRRLALVLVANEITNFELDLSLSVEAPRDLRLLVPSLRVVSYHEEIYAAIGLDQMAHTVSRMLQRLEATVRAELTSIESSERRADEDRRRRWAIAVGFVSTVAIPISLILSFLGINASQVDPSRSMFDPAYAWVYAGVGLLAITAVTLALALYLLQLRQHRERTGAQPAATPPLQHGAPRPRRDGNEAARAPHESPPGKSPADPEPEKAVPA
jgi:hypothetical protein